VFEKLQAARMGYMGVRGELFSSRAISGKRTYFFNVKENRNGDIFLNIVESKKNGEQEFERHSIIVFREDLDSFVEGFEKAVSFVQTKKS
jgi:hypothetical protein